MQKVKFIGAGSDLGVSIDGTRKAPDIILKNQKNKIILNQDENIIKSQNNEDLKKNLDELNQFNYKLYELLKKEEDFCFVVGGDHSIAIASGLASLKKHKNLGLIWIDAHLDYNTFQTTITGNLHGLPLATLNGLNQELSSFYEGEYFDPKKTVVVGYRAFEDNANDEINNIKTMGVTVYTTNDIKEYGLETIMKQAFLIANKDTNGIHISFDLDVIDPNLAIGVTVPEENGLDKDELNNLINYLNDNNDIIKSFDLVEYNPVFDKNNQTLTLANNIIKGILKRREK